MTSTPDPPPPPVATIVWVLAMMAGAVAWARSSRRRDLERLRRPAGDPLPDRVWSGEAPGPWYVTFAGKFHEILPGDLPRGRTLHKGLLSDADLRTLADSRVTDDSVARRMFRFERGDLSAAKLVHNTSDPDHVPWRIDALDHDGGYRLFGFADESEARGVFDMLREHILAPDAAVGEAEIDAARARDETEER